MRMPVRRQARTLVIFSGHWNSAGRSRNPASERQHGCAVAVELFLWF